jgi:hypothetical protein
MDDLLTFAFVEPAYRYHPEKRLLAVFGQKPASRKDAPKRKPVNISAAHHQQLVLLAGLPALGGIALGDLLDNMLQAFFEDYAPEIQAELQKLQNQFPRPDMPQG